MSTETGSRTRDGGMTGLGGQTVAFTPFQREVVSRFGVLPNFFCSTPSAPGVIEEMWGFARSAYLNSPLPSLFKERLFVHLSRFCVVRYCIVRHVGFLVGEGWPAGDPGATPQSIEQVIALLRRPVPDGRGFDAALVRLEQAAAMDELPDPETPLEADLFDVLTVLFLQPLYAARARGAVRGSFGEERYELLTAFLAFVRTAHYWTETHPELAYEPDMVELMEQAPELAQLLLDSSEAEAVQERERLRDAVAQLEHSLRASDERFRRAFEIDTVGVVFFSLDGAVHEANDAALRLTGYDRADLEQEKLHLEALTQPESRPALHEVLEQLRGAKRVDPYEREYLRKDGTRGPALFAPTLLDEGEAVVFMIDLTALRAAEAAAAHEHELREAREREFVANAAHDIRTPLAGIISAVDALDAGAKDLPEQRDLFFGHVRREAGRLKRLCDSLLLLTQIESEREIPVSQVDLRRLLESVASGLEPQPDVQLIVDAAESAAARTNHGLLERIVANLAENAVNHTSSGQIELRASTSENGTLVEIRDTGSGVSSDVANRAFDRFYRAEPRTGDGFGLGLSISSQAAAALGATLTLETASEGGTIARLLLPDRSG